MKMGRMISLFICAIFIISLVSAEIIINQEPKDIYNIGDVITFPIKIAAVMDTHDFLSVNLLCNGGETEIYKEYISLEAGDETGVTPNIPLLFDGERKTGTCKIKTILGESFVLSSDFEITNAIIVFVKPSETKFAPGDYVILEGSATKKDGSPFNGFLRVDLGGENTTTSVLETVKNGYFYVNFSLPENKKAGKYLVRVEAYQKGNDEKTTNTGFVDYAIEVAQSPKNLEVILEEEVEPGTNLIIRPILHDQTGENIIADAEITIRDSKGKLLNQVNIVTDEVFEFFISNNEPPLKWEVQVKTGDFSSLVYVKIKEKADVNINLINKTVIIKNIGNIPYVGLIPIKIGNITVEKNVSLGLGEEKKYILTAPDGNYNIEILGGNESLSSSGTFLTGKVIGIEDASAGVLSAIKMSVIWIFIIAILGFVVVTIFRKGYEKTFFGYIAKKRAKKSILRDKGEKELVSKLVNSKNPAELCLSIKGSKQNADVVSLKLSGVDDLDLVDTRIKESLQDIVNFADELKAATYENKDNIIFILTPIKTKTFKNEKAAMKIAQKAKEVLVKHNKLFKAKMQLGISMNYGTIIVKQEKVLKFMSMGTLIGQAKKIAGISKGRILLGEKINDRLGDFFKTKKQTSGGIEFYIITDVKDTEENKKFIDRFVKSLKEEKDAKSKKE